MSDLSHRVLDFIDDTTDRLNRDLRSMKSEMMSGFVSSDLSKPRSRASTRGGSASMSAAALPPGLAQDRALSTLAHTAVALEYAALRHAAHCPLGMYVAPAPEGLCVWDAVFFVHQGACCRPHSGADGGDEACAAARLLHGLGPQVPRRLPARLPRARAGRAVPHGRVPPARLAAGRDV